MTNARLIINPMLDNDQDHCLMFWCYLVFLGGFWSSPDGSTSTGGLLDIRKDLGCSYLFALVCSLC